jgi:hypothetical protein
MQQLRQTFVDHAVAGASVEQAIRLALHGAAAELRQGQAQGGPLQDIARRLGLYQLLDDGLATLAQFALTHWMKVPLSVLPGRGGVRDVPSPDCVESHLPSDRTPTRADYERAWDLCTAGQHP